MDREYTNMREATKGNSRRCLKCGKGYYTTNPYNNGSAWVGDNMPYQPFVVVECKVCGDGFKVAIMGE